jgi:hypothetical protein
VWSLSGVEENGGRGEAKIVCPFGGGPSAFKWQNYGARINRRQKGIDGWEKRAREAAVGLMWGGRAVGVKATRQQEVLRERKVARAAPSSE